ncbi:MAG: peroxiredoxin [Proteobacteria bacterium]|nr:peroxiredoxin [Pseudomonadota bacterium]
MIKINDTAPDFELKDQSGNTVSLTSLTEKGDVIVYFYPADFSPVCTAQTCSFRDNFAGLETAGVRIVGISPQSFASHQRFADTFSIPFPLLSDPDKQAVRAFGVDGPFGIGVRRATFLIDRNKVVRSRVVSDLFLSSHSDLIRETIKGREAA